MKTNYLMGLLIIVAGYVNSYPQDSVANKMELLDLKLQLIDTKLALLDSKINIWETKPRELELMLGELDKKILELDFQPDDFNRQFRTIDSMMSEYRKLAEQNSTPFIESVPGTGRTDIPVNAPKGYAMALNPVRVFEGTLEISYERKFNERNTIEISGMATYANNQGISDFYLSKQSLEYYNERLSIWDPYESENFSGFGATLQWKNYLLPAVNSGYAVFKGLYAAPYGMYRRIWITGLDWQYFPEEDEWKDVEIIQKLNILAGGVIIGWQFPIAKVLSVDIFAGGVIRLSHYDTESGFTKYKKWDNIDYSGVLPRAGIKIGILK
ncbi:MAG: hypothetical protein JW723_08220 [Bacteroidales bacterium]|nr:hypothetical protein [Bacteroidales bacterium]